MWEEDLSEDVREAVHRLSQARAVASAFRYAAYSPSMGISEETKRRLDIIVDELDSALMHSNKVYGEVAILIREGVIKLGDT